MVDGRWKQCMSRRNGCWCTVGCLGHYVPGVAAHVACRPCLVGWFVWLVLLSELDSGREYLYFLFRRECDHFLVVLGVLCVLFVRAHGGCLGILSR